MFTKKKLTKIVLLHFYKTIVMVWRIGERNVNVIPVILSATQILYFVIIKIETSLYLLRISVYRSEDAIAA